MISGSLGMLPEPGKNILENFPFVPGLFLKEKGPGCIPPMGLQFQKCLHPRLISPREACILVPMRDACKPSISTSEKVPRPFRACSRAFPLCTGTIPASIGQLTGLTELCVQRASRRRRAASCRSAWVTHAPLAPLVASRRLCLSLLRCSGLCARLDRSCAWPCCCASSVLAVSLPFRAPSPSAPRPLPALPAAGRTPSARTRAPSAAAGT